MRIMQAAGIMTIRRSAYLRERTKSTRDSDTDNDTQKMR